MIGAVPLSDAIWNCSMVAYAREQQRVERDCEIALLSTDTDQWQRLVIVQAGSITAPVSDQVGWLACLL